VDRPGESPGERAEIAGDGSESGAHGREVGPSGVGGFVEVERPVEFDLDAVSAPGRSAGGGDEIAAAVRIVELDAETGRDTAGQGTAVFNDVLDPVQLSATRAATDDASSAAVSLQDAIAILKMIVGLNVNASGPLSPYQVVAADYNRDGGVGLTDAIDVLKAVVGLNAPAPSWVVLEQSKVASSMTMDSYNADKTKSEGWMSSTLSVDLDKTPEIQLVGVLAGDVDGSWAG
jgi:hypothetical protein